MRHTVALGILALAVVCSSCKAEAEKPAVSSPPAVQVGSENVVAVHQGSIVVGPIVSGELKPEREATLRAEVGGSMLDVSVLEAQAVKMGAVLGRIETRTLDDARLSAASAVRSAENQLAVARREAERTEKLASAGALATRDVDAAHNAVSAAEAQLADHGALGAVAVLVLHHYADLPLTEIADVLGIPVGTVGSRLHTAAGRLRAALDGDCAGSVLVGGGAR